MGYTLSRYRKEEEEEKPNQMGTVERVFDILSRPVRAVAGGVRAVTEDEGNDSLGEVGTRMFDNLMGEKKDTFTDVAKDFGSTGLGAHMIGGAADMVLDPLNLLAVGPGAKLLKGGYNAAAKVGRKGFSYLPKAAKGVIREVAGQTFAMEPEVAKTARLAQSAYRSAPERVLEDLMNKGWTGETNWNALTPAMKANLDDSIAIRGRAQGQTVDDFLSTLAPDDPTRFSLQNRLDNVAEGYWDRIIRKKISGTRDLERAEAVQEFMSNPRLKEFSSSTPKKGMTLASEIQDITPQAQKNVGMNPTQYVPEDLVAGMKVTKKPASETEIGKGWDRILDAWRSSATKYRPAFHATNFAGNVYNIAADAKLNPATVYRRGSQFRKGTLDSSKLGGVEIDELTEALKKYDIDKGLGHHLTYDPTDVTKTLKGLKEAQAGGTGVFGKISHRIDKYISDPIERNARVGVAIADLERKTPEIAKRTDEYLRLGLAKDVAEELARQDILRDAVLQAKDTMFDYRELTPFQQQLRKFFPFATWTLKNTPLQMRSLAKNPAIPAKVGIGLDNIENLTKDLGKGVEEEKVPDWIKEPGGVALPFGDKKSQVFMRNILPTSELNFLNPTTPEALKQVGQMLGPPFRQALEVGGNFYLTSPKRAMFDERGMFGTPAAGTGPLQMIPESIGSKLFNVRKSSTDPDVKEYEVPAIVNYALQQIPALNAYGKAFTGMTNPEFSRDPLQILSLLGIPVTRQSMASLNKVKQARALEAKKQRGIEKSERKRRVSTARLPFLNDEDEE